MPCTLEQHVTNGNGMVINGGRTIRTDEELQVDEAHDTTQEQMYNSGIGSQHCVFFEGANASVTAAVVVVTGLVGANFVQSTLDKLRLRDSIAHGIATASRYILQFIDHSFDLDIIDSAVHSSITIVMKSLSNKLSDL
uniref:Uncharacterized protein n=1 Tax=Cajanus cajan TaxID=3821 RepID=A0A151THD7_CAJCA|nr:hypothetical protein KK1_012767 [Cajanus cajan]